MSGNASEPPPESSAEWFRTTHWSVVLAAGASSSPIAAEALERLCRTYWYPLYSFVRRKGYSPADEVAPKESFDLNWAETLPISMLARLRAASEGAGKEGHEVDPSVHVGHEDSS